MTRCNRRLGFTLLELMVVMSIVMITIAFVRLTVPDRAREMLAREGERLAMVLVECRRTAIFSGHPQGIRVDPDHYEMVQYIRRWAPATPDATRALPPRIVLSTVPTTPTDPAGNPAVVCLPSGETLRPTLRLTDQERSVYVELADNEDGIPDLLWGGSRS